MYEAIVVLPLLGSLIAGAIEIVKVKSGQGLS